MNSPSSPAATDLHPRLARQREIAQQLWHSYLQAGDFYQFDRWLVQEFKKHGRFGKRDRTLYREWLFAALRFGELAAQLLQPSPSSDPGAQDAHQLAAQWRSLDPHLFFAIIERRYADQPNNDGLLPPGRELPGDLEVAYQAAQQAAANTDLAATLRWQGIPAAYLGAIEERARQSGWHPAELSTWLRAQCLRPPVWLRINQSPRRKEIVDELGDTLMTQDADALALQPKGSLLNLRCFQEGWVELQDLASQRLGAAVAAAPGQCVWDACAGGGGKTLQIASRLQQQGQILASDIRVNKLKELLERGRKAGFRNLRTERWDGNGLPKVPPAILDQGGFDWVLVDAPCSSSGTWRRSPDVKLRELGNDLVELSQLQQRLLLSAAQAVKPGGHLVYGTCSFQVAENEAVVANLAQQPGWQLLRQEILGCPQEDADTMFVAVLRKQD